MSAGSEASRRRVALRHLEYFVAVVDHGSIAAAADELFVAASGVSQTIAELEARLDVRLFERSRSGSLPTMAGQAMVEPARRALATFAEATSSGRSVAAGPGSIVVLSTPSLVQEPTARLLGDLHREVPGVSIRLREPTTALVADVVHPVLSGTVDVAITEHPERHIPGTRIVRLPDQRVRLVCPPGTPAPRDGVFEVPDLLSIGLIVAPLFESSDVYRRLDAIEPRVHEAIVVRTDHRDALMMLARSGAGAALLEEGRAERARRLGCVVGELAGLPARKVAAVALAARSVPVLDAFLDICARGPGGGLR